MKLFSLLCILLCKRMYLLHKVHTSKSFLLNFKVCFLAPLLYCVKEWSCVLQHLDLEDSGLTSSSWEPPWKLHPTEPGCWRSLWMASVWIVVFCSCAVFSQASQSHPWQTEKNRKEWCSQQPRSWVISVLQLNLLTLLLPLCQATCQFQLEKDLKW